MTNGQFTKTQKANGDGNALRQTETLSGHQRKATKTALTVFPTPHATVTPATKLLLDRGQTSRQPAVQVRLSAKLQSE